MRAKFVNEVIQESFTNNTRNKPIAESYEINPYQVMLSKMMERYAFSDPDFDKKYPAVRKQWDETVKKRNEWDDEHTTGPEPLLFHQTKAYRAKNPKHASDHPEDEGLGRRRFKEYRDKHPEYAAQHPEDEEGIDESTIQIPFTNNTRNKPISGSYPLSRIQYEDADKKPTHEWNKDYEDLHKADYEYSQAYKKKKAEIDELKLTKEEFENAQPGDVFYGTQGDRVFTVVVDTVEPFRLQ